MTNTDIDKIMNGNKLAKKIYSDLSQKVNSLKEEGKTPCLTAYSIGNDHASDIYLKIKRNKCGQVGIKFILKEFNKHGSSAKSAEEIIEDIQKTNRDDDIHGIIVQLPLPPDMKDDENRIINSVSPLKDVDGFTNNNLGKLIADTPFLTPCTPKGIMRLLKYYGVDIEGKRAVVLGRSLIVGKPIALLLLQENATVTICHSRTSEADKIEFCSKADILIVAIGRPYYIDKKYVKKGAVVVDVGINKISKEDAWDDLLIDDSKTKDFDIKGYTLIGDVNLQDVYKEVSLITPVPGGVGPLTVAELLGQVVYNCEHSN